jgi:hypothetical protein
MIELQVTSKAHQDLEELRVHEMLAAPHKRIFVVVLPEQSVGEVLE